MTPGPALAAKAREIAFDTWPRDKRDRANLEKLQAAILSALIDADAAATERAAKVAEDEDGHFSHWGEDHNTRVARRTCRAIAAAIRNQEPTDADA